MGLIGTIISRMSTNQIFVGLIAFVMFVGSIGLGAYTYAREEGEVLCLSCLGLDPVVPGFDDWWVNYPSSFEKAGSPVSHPSWVRDSLRNYDVVMIFFWQPACDGCDEQWEDMKDDDLVQGTESSGSMDKYSSEVKLYSLDIQKTNGRDAFDAYAQFRPKPGTPTTTFVIRLPDGSIGWYSHLNKMSAGEVDGMLQIAMHE